MSKFSSIFTYIKKAAILTFLRECFTAVYITVGIPKYLSIGIVVLGSFFTAIITYIKHMPWWISSLLVILSCVFLVLLIIVGRNIRKEKIRIFNITTSALEMSTPPNLSIECNSNLDINIYESTSRKQIQHDWIFELKNTKNEVIKAVEVKFTSECDLMRLKKDVEIFLENFLRDQGIIFYSNQNPLHFIIRKNSGNNFSERSLFYDNKGKAIKLNSVPGNSSVKIKMPDEIVTTIILYCLQKAYYTFQAPSNTNLESLPAYFPYYRLPNVQVSLSYILENAKIKVEQQFNILAKMGRGGGGAVNNNITNLQALVIFEQIDHSQQTVRIKK